MTIALKSVVAIHYTLTDAGGVILDASQPDRPLVYLQGAGNIIPGLEQQLLGRAAGERFTAVIPPAAAYGEHDADLIQSVPRATRNSPLRLAHQRRAWPAARACRPGAGARRAREERASSWVRMAVPRSSKVGRQSEVDGAAACVDSPMNSGHAIHPVFASIDMLHSQTHLRSRPVQAGYLRAFEAVARHLNFRMAAEEMALTQSAVSRQIQSLEDEVGVPLFLRHTRAVELTTAGMQLLQAVGQALPRIDAAVRHIRQSSGRRHVSVTTFASFASMWLIPKLEAFQRAYPDIDIRIEASDSAVDLEVADLDVAVRYAPAERMAPGARRLFGESVTPMVSPWLLKSGPPLRKPEDLLQLLQGG